MMPRPTAGRARLGGTCRCPGVAGAEQDDADGDETGCGGAEEDEVGGVTTGVFTEAWLEVDGPSSFQTVAHTQVQNTTASASQPIRAAPRPAPASSAPVPAATPAARDTSSLKPAEETRTPEATPDGAW